MARYENFIFNNLANMGTAFYSMYTFMHVYLLKLLIHVPRYSTVCMYSHAPKFLYPLSGIREREGAGKRAIATTVLSTLAKTVFPNHELLAPFESFTGGRENRNKWKVSLRTGVH